MYTCYFKDNNNFDVIKQKVIDSILDIDILSDYCFNDSTKLEVTNDYFRLIVKKTDELIVQWKKECDIEINYELWFEDYYSTEGGYGSVSKIVEVIGGLLKRTSEDLLVYSSDLACILRKNDKIIVDDSSFIYPTEEKFPFWSLGVEYDYGDLEKY